MTLCIFHKLTYDVHTREVKFANTFQNTICATKQVTVPVLTSSIISAKFNAKVIQEKTYNAKIHCPLDPTITSIPAII